MNRSIHFRVHFLFAAMGFATMVAQIVIMRRLIVVYGGNELVSGAVLAGWLGFSGVGNLIAGRFADRIIDVRRAAAISLFALAAAIPLTTAAATLIKVAFGIPPPAMVGLPIALVSTIMLMAPLGILIGNGFVISCRIPETRGATNIGRVYALDAIGAGLGGALYSLLAIRYLSPIQAGAVAAAVLIAAVGVTLRRPGIKLAAVLLVGALAVTNFFSPNIEAGLAGFQWQGYNPVVQKESLFASLMVTDNRGERTLFVDGKPSFSLPLPETYESIAHLPLAEHTNPKDVALVGGGISGMIDQWRDWKLDQALFLRLDPDETWLERYAMPSNLESPPRWAKIHHADGRHLIKDGLPDGCRESCLDVIIINVGDPDTAAADRYFTVEFLREAKRMLRPDGILCLALLEPANVLGEEAARLLGTVRATVGQVFEHILVLPLDRFYFFASPVEGALTDDLDELERRLDQRGIKAHYLTTWVLAGVYPERIRSFRQGIEEAAQRSTVNTDLRPIAYYAGMVLWEGKAGRLGSGVLRALEGLNPWIGLAALLTLLVLSLLVRKGWRPRMKATWALAAVGAAAMAYEIVLIVHYQMEMGVLIWRIGLILTAFMVGAGGGAVLAIRWLDSRCAPQWVLIISLISLAGYVIFEPLFVAVSFIAANFIMGVLCGWIYQLVTSRLVAARGGVGASAGIIESADHWGAAFGAVAASVAIVPLFGLKAALLAASSVIVAATAIVALVPTGKQ